MAISSDTVGQVKSRRVSMGALGLLLIACLVSLLAAITLYIAVPATSLPRSALIFLALAALATGLASLFLYTTRLLPAIGRLTAVGESARKNIDALSIGIVKLSTGDLAATVDLPEAVAVGDLSGALAGLSVSMGGIDSAVSQSIDAFDDITNEPCRRTFYVGSDSYEEGLAAGEAVGKILKGSGRLCAVIGDDRSTTYKLRMKGLTNRLSEKYPGVELVEVAETHESCEGTYAAVQGFVQKYKNLEAVYVAEGATIHCAGKAVEDARRSGKTAVVGHDLTDETMKLMSRGVIGATISQDPYAQGHDSIIRLYNCVAANWRPTVPRHLTKLETVTPANYSLFWSASAGAIYDERSHLASPLPRPEGRRDRVRIAVVCPSKEGFWKAVYEGATDAKAELSKLDAEVEIAGPPPELENDRAVSTYAPIIERLVAEGCLGIAIPVFSRAMIPAINKAVRAGVAVGSFNSEPVSLREMVSSVQVHADSLIGLSQELAASAEESGQSTLRIGETMDKIGGAIDSQLRDVSRTNEELRTLIADIAKVSDATDESAESARNVAASSAEGFKSVSEMRKTVKSLEDASSVAESAIRSLKGDTDKIGTIVAAISDISNQTNVLAINASIQAARAGELGKGFSVIAAEIRKLADQSNRSTQEITSLISLVQERVESATDATGLGLSQAKANSAHAELSEKSLRDISAIAVDNERRMEIIRDAIEDITKFSGKVEETVRSLSAANRQSEDASVEVRSSTQEMAAQSADVASAAQALSQMAKDQHVLLSQFRVEKAD